MSILSLLHKFKKINDEITLQISLGNKKKVSILVQIRNDIKNEIKKYFSKTLEGLEDWIKDDYLSYNFFDDNIDDLKKSLSFDIDALNLNKGDDIDDVVFGYNFDIENNPSMKQFYQYHKYKLSYDLPKIIEKEFLPAYELQNIVELKPYISGYGNYLIKK